MPHFIVPIKCKTLPNYFYFFINIFFKIIFSFTAIHSFSTHERTTKPI